MDVKKCSTRIITKLIQTVIGMQKPKIKCDGGYMVGMLLFPKKLLSYK